MRSARDPAKRLNGPSLNEAKGTGHGREALAPGDGQATGKRRARCSDGELNRSVWITLACTVSPEVPNKASPLSTTLPEVPFGNRSPPPLRNPRSKHPPGWTAQHTGWGVSGPRGARVAGYRRSSGEPMSSLGGAWLLWGRDCSLRIRDSTWGSFCWIPVILCRGRNRT